MFPSELLRIRLRVVALLLASVLAATTAVALLIQRDTLNVAHPVLLAASFVVIAAVSLLAAVRLRRDAT